MRGRKRRGPAPAHQVQKGQHVKIRHIKGQWSMTIGGRELVNVRGVAVRFGAGQIDTVAVEFFPGSVSIDTDEAQVALVQPGQAKATIRQRIADRWRHGW